MLRREGKVGKKRIMGGGGETNRGGKHAPHHTTPHHTTPHHTTWLFFTSYVMKCDDIKVALHENHFSISVTEQNRTEQKRTK